jgi:hypothetical protein
MPTGTAARKAPRFRRTRLCGQLEDRQRCRPIVFENCIPKRLSQRYPPRAMSRGQPPACDPTLRLRLRSVGGAVIKARIAPAITSAAANVTTVTAPVGASSRKDPAFLLVVLLFAPLAGVGQVSAEESDELRSVETGQSPAAKPRPTVPVDNICNALAAAATENDLRIDFFTRLIWQESRFNPMAVSRAGAQERGTVHAGDREVARSCRSLRSARSDCPIREAPARPATRVRKSRPGAATYNAGPGRVRDWLAGRGRLPRETSAYVRLVTGQSAEQWSAAGRAPRSKCRLQTPYPVGRSLAFFAPPPAVAIKPPDPWGAQLVGSSSDATALAAYRRLQEKHASILAGREPRVVHHGLARGSMGWARSGSERRAARVVRNCALTCAPPARAARCNAIENPGTYLTHGTSLDLKMKMLLVLALLLTLSACQNPSRFQAEVSLSGR